MGFYKAIDTRLIKYNKSQTNKKLRTINVRIAINDGTNGSLRTNSRSYRTGSY